MAFAASAIYGISVSLFRRSKAHSRYEDFLSIQPKCEQISAAIIDDAPMNLAIESGLCAKLEEGPNLKNVHPSARRVGGPAIGLGYGATGLVYNTAAFSKKGWPAPTSWKDLEDKRYTGKLVIPPISDGFGLLALVMEARMNGGGENSPPPAVRCVHTQLDSNFSNKCDKTISTQEGLQ